MVTARSSSCRTKTVGGPDAGGRGCPADPSVPDRRDARPVPSRERQLYACGLFAWAGDQTQPGGFYRVRATGKPMFLPVGLSARKEGMAITFTDPLDPEDRDRPNRVITAKTWTIKRTVNYGSDHFDERAAMIAAARLSADGRTVVLEIPGIAPTWCMEITYRIKGAAGEPVEGVIHNTIHQLATGEKELIRMR